MSLVKYIGPEPGVYVPAASASVLKGNSITVSPELAISLLAQAGTWEAGDVATEELISQPLNAPFALQEIIGASPLTRLGVFTPVPPPILPETVTLLPEPKNGTLEAGHGWSRANGFGAGSNLNYTGETGLANQCIKLETLGAGEIAVIVRNRETAMNLKGKHLRFWFKVDAGSSTSLKELAVRVGSGVSAFTSSMKTNVLDKLFAAEPLVEFAKAGEWFSWTVSPVGMQGREGEPNWEAIQDIQIRLFDYSAGPATIYFGGVEIITNDSRYPNGVVTLGFDDNYVSQMEMAAYLAKYGFRGDAYITGSRLNEAGHLTTAQLEHLAQVNGWDVHVHCYLGSNNVSPTTGMTPLPTQTIIQDWDNCKGLIHELGLNGPNHWAVPSGRFDNRLLKLAKQKFSSARIVQSLGAETVPPADPYRMRIVGMTVPSTVTPDTTPGTMEWIVKQVSEWGGWAHFLFHDMAAAAKEPNTIEEAKFKTLIDYIAAKGVPVRKVSEVLGV